MYYGGFTWREFYHYPVQYRYWLIKRIDREIQKKVDDGNEIPSKGAHHNTPDARAITNKMRQMVPARLQRFT